MKRLIIFFTLVVFCATSAVAQKLVIGSRAKAFRPDTDLQWITTPAPENLGYLVDFYSSKNPSCVKFYENLPSIAKKLDGKIPIVIISRTDDEAFKELAKRDATKYYFAIDKEGKAYNAFGIQYVPYSVLLSGNNDVVWQGNLSKVEEQVLAKVK